MTNRERVADFLAITYSDCNLLCLPERTSTGYLAAAGRICELLGVDADSAIDQEDE